MKYSEHIPKVLEGKPSPILTQSTRNATPVASPKPALHRQPGTDFTKALSISSLILILASGMFLSIVIANSARQTLLAKQQEFGLILAENLNHQIYIRFIVPTMQYFQRIALRQPAQYEGLKKIILNTIHGLHIQELRIYDPDHVVSFSTSQENVGKESLAGLTVCKAFEKGEHGFEITSHTSPLGSFLQGTYAPGSVILKTFYPLRLKPEGDKSIPKGTIIGVLEIAQDISDDYHTVVRFQWLIVITTLISSVALFLVLLVIIRKVDRLNAQGISERERLERELHQSEKMASMGRMVAGIAHEIRNPLGIIRSSAELLLKKYASPEDLNGRILKAIFDESQRLSQTVSDFLDYARPRQPKQEVVDLARLLDQALMFLEQDSARSKVMVERRYLLEMCSMRVLGDKDLLYRALYNTLTNALQAMANQVEAENKKQTGRLIIESSATPTELTLTFTDNGPGFDEAIKDKLMDPFFTTKDQGTGLGLAITNNIIRSHDGDLSVENAARGGTRVTIKLPRILESALPKYRPSRSSKKNNPVHPTTPHRAHT
ncbi:Histidine kinase [Desulfovibrionales bacterium]